MPPISSSVPRATARNVEAISHDRHQGGKNWRTCLAWGLTAFMARLIGVQTNPRLPMTIEMTPITTGQTVLGGGSTAPAGRGGGPGGCE